MYAKAKERFISLAQYGDGNTSWSSFSIYYKTEDILLTPEDIMNYIPEFQEVSIDYDSSGIYKNGIYVSYSIEICSGANFLYYFRTKDESTLNDKNKESIERIKALSKELGLAEKTEAEKVQAVHDFIVDYTAYDTSFNSISHFEYGLLENKIAVCDGYSKTFLLFMLYNNIDCIIVTAPGHAWNQVKVNGTWYNLDATWDDPLVNGKDSGTIYYDYFLISTEDLHKLDSSSSHQIESNNAKECKVTFDRNKIVPTAYMQYYGRTDAEIEELLKAQKDNEIVCIMVNTADGYTFNKVTSIYRRVYNTNSWSYYKTITIGTYEIYRYVGPLYLSANDLVNDYMCA